MTVKKHDKVEISGEPLIKMDNEGLLYLYNTSPLHPNKKNYFKINGIQYSSIKEYMETKEFGAQALLTYGYFNLFCQKREWEKELLSIPPGDIFFMSSDKKLGTGQEIDPLFNRLLLNITDARNLVGCAIRDALSEFKVFIETDEELELIDIIEEMIKIHEY